MPDVPSKNPGLRYLTSAEPAIHSRFRVRGQLADAPEGAAGVDDPGTPGHRGTLQHLLQARLLQQLRVLGLHDVHLVVLGTFDEGIGDGAELPEVLRLEAPGTAQERELPQLRLDGGQVALGHGALQSKHCRTVLFQGTRRLALPVGKCRQWAVERHHACGHGAQHLAPGGHARAEGGGERQAQRARCSDERQGQGQGRHVARHGSEVAVRSRQMPLLNR
mmetsp:Transcript_28844/g.75029  ORF Transcript_28844/g.75029 Transcript_28844/m.75029 type:complete len:220 (+) Transcript_28844:91-750(+)